MGKRAYYKNFEEHWKVKESGYSSPCWLWRGALTVKGYGQVVVMYKTLRAHRYVFELYNEVKLEASETLDHLCRNRHCVNPAHMEVVPNKVNVRRGKNTKLTEKQVEEIRTLLPSKSRSELAISFGVSKETISGIAVRRTWR